LKKKYGFGRVKEVG